MSSAPPATTGRAPKWSARSPVIGARKNDSPAITENSTDMVARLTWNSSDMGLRKTPKQ